MNIPYELSKSSQLLLVVSKKIGEYYDEEAVQNIHILMSLAYLDGPIKDYLNSYGISFSYLEYIFYCVDEPFSLNEDSLSDIDTVVISSETLTCIEKAISKSRANNKYTYPEDILFEIINDNDCMVMSILDGKVSNLESFIDGLMSCRKNKNKLVIEPQRLNNKLLQRNLKNNSVLKQYGINLIEEAIKGAIDEVSCRESEINRLIEILGRKNKSNPCLVGDAGVGKTAIVEGLALKISRGDVPDFLKDTIIYSLDMGLLVSGTKYRGDFEERLETIVREVKTDHNIILFLDEIHTIVNSGSSEGAMDAGNILKPYLARGVIKCIGATTNKEYKNYIEKDSALERRFQKIVVNEPSIENCINILLNTKKSYESHHNVLIPKEVVKLAVELSDRYISDRFLPDKAFDLLDEACSRVKINGTRKKLIKKDIIDVLYKWTGIPVEDLSVEKSQKYLNLEDYLTHNIIGQELAVRTVSKAILRSQAGLRDSSKPIASFIFSGPTGVGKTELAKCLSKYLFDTDKSLIRIDMSEYMDKISVSKLIGAAPGYVGYKEGGQLTEAVRRKPYSVVLLDEIEKAHPDVLNIFLQILDNGKVTDGLGKTVDFRNTILIFTSNLYNPYEEKKVIGFPVDKNTTASLGLNYHEEAIKKFSSKFSPEFVNRFDDIIVFNKLGEDEMLKILDLLLRNLKGILKKKGIRLSLTRKTKLFLLGNCDFSTMGARPLKRILTKYIEDELSLLLLSGDIKKGSSVKVTCKNNSLSFVTGECKTKEYDKLITV